MTIHSRSNIPMISMDSFSSVLSKVQALQTNQLVCQISRESQRLVKYYCFIIWPEKKGKLFQDAELEFPKNLDHGPGFWGIFGLLETTKKQPTKVSNETLMIPSLSFFSPPSNSLATHGVEDWNALHVGSHNVKVFPPHATEKVPQTGVQNLPNFMIYMNSSCFIS